jgi:hypothetical protein
MRTATVLTLASLISLPVAANVIEGDTAPMIVSVDERMRALDMADLVDGAPLVFLYGSAT